MILWSELFTCDQPVELEIGSGKGGFILEQARAHPERNFLGLEWANKYFKYAAQRMVRWGVHNVRLSRVDAAHFVPNYIPTASLAAVHVYHPDPWPKARHHKRRLFQPDFVETLVRILHDGGTVSAQTDHREYFGVIKAVLDAHEALERTHSDSENGTEGVDLVPTNFQIKYCREGRHITRLVYRRTARRSGDGGCSGPPDSQSSLQSI